MSANRRDPRLEDREWLRRKYEDDRLKMSEIADLIGASTSAVHRAITKHNIPTRHRPRLSPFSLALLEDRDWCHEAVHDRELTQAQIAERLGASPAAVSKAFIRHKIPSRQQITEATRRRISKAQRTRRPMTTETKKRMKAAQLARWEREREERERPQAELRGELRELLAAHAGQVPERLRITLAHCREIGHDFDSCYEIACQVAIAGTADEWKGVIDADFWAGVLKREQRQAWESAYLREGERLKIDGLLQMIIEDSYSRRADTYMA